MKIAIIGTGIAGNVVAARLHPHHDITVFEATDHVGGHTHTHDIEHAGGLYAIDTGFIVFNKCTYPNFLHLLAQLGIEPQPSKMSFSVQCARSGIEYSGRNLNTLFAQRRNLLRPGFLGMLRDILRFNRNAPALLEGSEDDLGLGAYLQRNGYGRAFVEHYIIPMGAAIWSADPKQMYDFPARYFIQFFANHGLLSVNKHPQWYVIPGGSRSYVDRLATSFLDRIRLNTPVRHIRRHPDRVAVYTEDAGTEHFDQVFLACHSDQALAILDDASVAERSVLGAIRYQPNEAVLHTDVSLMPKRRLAWAAWNYHVPAGKQHQAAVTYNMNILQDLRAPVQFCVTLNNPDAIDPRTIIKRIRYDHPVYTAQAVQAQQRHCEINGAQRTYFCGAYWGYGFHEDGVVSALRALQHFNEHQAHAQLHLRRTA